MLRYTASGCKFILLGVTFAFFVSCPSHKHSSLSLLSLLGGTQGSLSDPIGTPNLCTPGEKRCSGTLPQTCDAGGNWEDGTACSGGETCGGGGVVGVCGQANCTNLCLKQTTCPNPNTTTTISGTVYAPNGTDPLMNALVYVPNAPVSAFSVGVTCDTCGSTVSGSPLIRTVTGPDGKFSLGNAPVGTNIPLVIQVGRWRRQITIPSVSSCADTALNASSTRLPRNKMEGDIPLMAVVTSSSDGVECVLRKIGVADTEFTSPASTGRVHLYTGTGNGGATSSGNGQPTEDTLWSTAAALNKYDMLFFPSQAAAFSKTVSVQQNLINYANAGGRIFTAQFSYVWLYNIAPFSGTASWNVGQTNISSDPQVGYVSSSFPKGQALALWLSNVGASSTPGQIQLSGLKHDLNSVLSPAQSWIALNDASAGTVPMQLTFNTPVGAVPAQQCGRVLYNEYSSNSVIATPSTAFPGECGGSPMSAKEKLIEFAIFDLATCITPDVPVCVPRTCAQLGSNCGAAGDGCGGILNCGTCSIGQTCGGGGSAGVCGSSTCVPRTCAQQGFNCGAAGDGCGGMISCGTCSVPRICGGSGVANQCGGSGPY